MVAGSNPAAPTNSPDHSGAASVLRTFGGLSGRMGRRTICNVPRVTVIAAAVALVVLIGLIALVALPGTTDLGFRGVILGAVIAGVVSIGGEWLRSQHEARLDAQKRTDDRRIESDRLQRENLLKLQDDVLRALAATEENDRTTASARAHVRSQRVLDDDLRAQVDLFLKHIADGDDESSHNDYKVLRNNIGAVLRSYLRPPLG